MAPISRKPDPRRQMQGKINRAEGKEFEKRIQEAFDYVNARGAAVINKVPEPIKIIKRLEAGQFIAVFEKKAQPDYEGTLKGGRSVLYEAKYTSGDKIGADRVTEAQADYLTKKAAVGAFCYVLAGFPSGRVYKIPWKIWRDMKAYFGRKYIKETDPELQQYVVKTANFGILMII